MPFMRPGALPSNAIDHHSSQTGPVGPSRREFLLAAGFIGVTAAASTALVGCSDSNEFAAPLLEFPEGFTWGVGTSAYQIEGAYNVAGRKPSVWDTFCRVPGNVLGNATGDVACDHYNLYPSDVALIAALGVKHYRLSIAWPRIIPDGRGKVNEQGVDFYKRLLDELEANGITAHATLFHWDTPQALQDKYRGWESREIAGDFADYCTATVDRLGDRVKHWYTTNEIRSFVHTAYTYPGGPFDGAPPFAPGIELKSEQAFWQTSHNALLAQGMGVQAVRASASRGSTVTLVEDSVTYVPLTETAEDIEATAKAFRSMSPNGGIIVPILTGEYDPIFLENLGASAPKIQAGDMEIISTPIDGFGFNTYSASYVRAADNNIGAEELDFPEGYPTYQSSWLKFAPDTVYWGVRMFSESLGLTDLNIVVTESGASQPDAIDADGEVMDTGRVMYLRETLKSAHRAIEEGYPLDGFFVWSFMDNFEWANGYVERFGITYVDFDTQQRTPKESYDWFGEVVAQNRVL